MGSGNKGVTTEIEFLILQFPSWLPRPMCSKAKPLLQHGSQGNDTAPCCHMYHSFGSKNFYKILKLSLGCKLKGLVKIYSSYYKWQKPYTPPIPQVCHFPVSVPPMSYTPPTPSFCSIEIPSPASGGSHLHVTEPHYEFLNSSVTPLTALLLQ